MAASAYEKHRAVQMRLKGTSVLKIAKILGRSKSTIWAWLRHVPVTPEQRRALLVRSNIRGIAEQSRAKAVQNRKQWRDEAKEQWTVLQTDPFFLLGLGLYWGEGHKTSCLELSNSDSGLLKLWVVWCRRFFPSHQMGACVMIHRDTVAKDAQTFWQNQLGLPVKVYWYPNRSKVGNRFFHKKLLFGTARVSVKRSVDVFIKVMEWIRLMTVSWPSTSG